MQEAKITAIAIVIQSPEGDLRNSEGDASWTETQFHLVHDIQAAETQYQQTSQSLFNYLLHLC